MNGRATTGDPDDGRQASVRHGGAGSRRGLKNWRVRARLVLLIAIPTLTAVVLGGTRIVASVQSSLADQRVEQLAELSSNTTVLAQGLENERDQTAYFIGLGTRGGRTDALTPATQANGTPAIKKAAPKAKRPSTVARGSMKKKVKQIGKGQTRKR